MEIYLYRQGGALWFEETSSLVFSVERDNYHNTGKASIKALPARLPCTKTYIRELSGFEHEPRLFPAQSEEFCHDGTPRMKQWKKRRKLPTLIKEPQTYYLKYYFPFVPECTP